MLRHSLLQPGVLLAVADDEASLTPDAHAPLVDAIQKEASAGPVAVLLRLGEGVRGIAIQTSGYWLQLVRDPGLSLVRFGIVTRAPAPLVAARSFARASSITGGGAEIAAFDVLADGLAFVRAVR